MDWDQFFERTKNAAGVDSYSKLAPLLGITDGAIGHYRQGRRIPQVWVVAEALKIQGHPTPEKAAIEIMKAAALTSSERTFWKRLAATTAGLMLAISLSIDAQAENVESADKSDTCRIHYAQSIGGLDRGLTIITRRLGGFHAGHRTLLCLAPAHPM